MPYWTICSICGVFGILESFAFGIWQESLTFLLVVMGIDYIVGATAAITSKKGLNAIIGANVLARKGLMFLVVLLAHRIDVLLDMEDMAKTGTIFFYTANELISIIEKLGRAGVALPPGLRRMIEELKDKNNEEPKDKDKNNP